MINRVTGEVGFLDGLHIVPHCPIQSLFADAEDRWKIGTQQLSLQGWQRHVLGFHASEHGTFETEVLSTDGGRVVVVLLAHRQPFHKPAGEDEERRAYHEGVIISDLAGQKEFTWGEVLCRLERAAHKDWLVIAYCREAKVPAEDNATILHLMSHEKLCGEAA
jgi:hypothetical protein